MRKIIYLRKATLSDFFDIKLLWQSVFGDSEDYINRFIAHFGIENCHICEINKKIVAMAFALPILLSYSQKFDSQILNLNSLYVYACATHPHFRKKGIMKKLLTSIFDEACYNNVVGIFLHAANKDLANYYCKLGFENFFYRKCLIFNRKKTKKKTKSTKNNNFILHTAYLKKRIQKLEKNFFVNWNEFFFKFNNETGMQFCEFEDAIFSFRIEENKIIVDEFLGDNQVNKIIEFLFEQFPEIHNIEFNLQGNENCYGQIKWCKSYDQTFSKGYFAFAME